MTLANFQIDGKSPVSQMPFMRSKRVWSADSKKEHAVPIFFDFEKAYDLSFLQKIKRSSKT
jgi:hypothetical protein